MFSILGYRRRCLSQLMLRSGGIGLESVGFSYNFKRVNTLEGFGAPKRIIKRPGQAGGMKRGHIAMSTTRKSEKT